MLRSNVLPLVLLCALLLAAEIGRHAFDLEVECSDGVVSLRGTVPDEERHRIALRAAESTSGVKKVIDLLRVGG